MQGWQQKTLVQKFGGLFVALECRFWCAILGCGHDEFGDVLGEEGVVEGEVVREVSCVWVVAVVRELAVRARGRERTEKRQGKVRPPISRAVLFKAREIAKERPTESGPREKCRCSPSFQTR